MTTNHQTPNNTATTHNETNHAQREARNTRLQPVSRNESTGIVGGCIHCAVDIYVNHGCPNDLYRFPTDAELGSI